MGINTIRVPLDGVICKDDGRYYILINGKLEKIVYVHDVKCWFLHTETDEGWVLQNPVWQDSNNVWIEGNMQNFASRPIRKSLTHMELKLPAIPEIGKNPSPIPDDIHYIWIGKGRMPEQFAENIIANVKKASGLKQYLHIHIHTEAGLQEIQEQFSDAQDLTIVNLTKEKWFQTFLSSELGGYYTLFTDGICVNLAAAADILRLIIMHKNGGIYLDVDNFIYSEIPSSAKLHATTDDILLNFYHLHLIENTAHINSINNSVFACCPGSQILKKITNELLHRLRKNQWIFQTPRPTIKKDMTKEEASVLNAYIYAILNITGPYLYQSILEKRKHDFIKMPKYMQSVFNLLNFNEKEPKIIAQEYMEKLLKAKSYYYPFGELNFIVRDVCAHTWFSEEHEPHPKSNFVEMLELDVTPAA